MVVQFPKWVQFILVLVIMVVLTELTKVLLSKIRVRNHRIQTVITLFHSTIQYVAMILGLVWILRIAGVDVNTIFASVGIVALIVGFSAESLIADVITGLFMIFENQFNVGDVVEIDGYRGSVEQIGIRTISIRDSGDNVKIVNNSNIKNMINLSSNISKAVCTIGISYEDDLEQVEELLKTILDDIYEVHRDVFLKKPVYIGVQDFGDMALMLRFLAEVEEMHIFTGRRILNREIYLGLKKNGIKIPYKAG